MRINKKGGQIPSDRTKEGRRGKRAPRSKEWQGPRSIVVSTTLTMAKRCRALQAASRIARGRERKGPASDGPAKILQPCTATRFSSALGDVSRKVVLRTEARECSATRVVARGRREGEEEEIRTRKDGSSEAPRLLSL